MMDITNFVVSQREKALSVGDYASYRKQLSRRLLVVRKKLHYTSIKGQKYAARPAVTAEDIAKDHEFVNAEHLLCDCSYRSTDSYTYSSLLLTELGPLLCI